jgi:hypothetical protein
MDDKTEGVIYHNCSERTVVVPKNLRIGYIADFTADWYHACASFDPDEHPTMFDAAMNGDWNNHSPVPDVEGTIKGDTCAMSDPWNERWQHGSTDAMCDPETRNDLVVTHPSTEVDINGTDDISAAQAACLRETVEWFSSVFEDHGTVARESEDDHMRITLKPGAEIVNKGPYNNSAKDRAVIDESFDRYHQEGKMGWAPPGLVRTAYPAFVVWQNAKGRAVMDISGLNASVWKDPYPMPRQEDILQAMKGCHWLTTLDLTAAFMQRALHKDSQHLVTVVTHRGPEYFKVVPFGFTNSPAHMQRFTDGKLRDMKKSVRYYIWREKTPNELTDGK